MICNCSALLEMLILVSSAPDEVAAKVCNVLLAEIRLLLKLAIK